MISRQRTVQSEQRQITPVCRVEKYLYTRSQLSLSSLSLWKLLAQTSWGSRCSATAAAVASHHRAEQDTQSPTWPCLVTTRQGKQFLFISSSFNTGQLTGAATQGTTRQSDDPVGGEHRTLIIPKCRTQSVSSKKM